MITSKSKLLGTVVRLDGDRAFCSGVSVIESSANGFYLMIRRFNDKNRNACFAIRVGPLW